MEEISNVTLIIIVLVIIIVFAFCFEDFFLREFIFDLLFRRRPKDINGKHVVVTGGSSGIGKCVAILAAKHGAHVTIIARNTHKLHVAKHEIIDACKDQDVQKVKHLALDIGKDYDAVEKALGDLERTMGPIYMLVNCAGTAICGKIEDTSIIELQQLTRTNFLGSYYCIKAVAQRMKVAQEGIIVLTASEAALLGIFGYSAYCSTKFALRGLAESISMEFAPYNISVTLSVPPDTDTPGFAVKQLYMTRETKLICETSNLVSPEAVAEKLFKDALIGKFFSTVGVKGFMLTVLCSGMSPFHSTWIMFWESMLMGIFRLVGAFFRVQFQNIIRDCTKNSR
ncbi:hypothetical protein K0M31_003058 [Melipona bicolor]|uniref:3-dehydrosphinganine reductase n=1 Tax=Melipona bicolor TaxID=60889 RepID=A0AA40G061_9HYME|nr:hypothetical protein K0M31_003058 [Melipona bicolor]